jgi:phosphoenolpyruvate carboxykinase (GTP)
VLKWVFERVTGDGRAVPSPIGNLPAPGAIDVAGLKVADADMAALLKVDVEGWIAELPVIRAHFAKFGAKLPAGLSEEFQALDHRLQAAAVEAGR